MYGISNLFELSVCDMYGIDENRLFPMLDPKVQDEAKPRRKCTLKETWIVNRHDNRPCLETTSLRDG